MGARGWQVEERGGKKRSRTRMRGGAPRALMGTGMPYSHTSIFLSSAVVTKRRASSQKVIVLTAARCWS
jgi:hypothetical protein